MKKGFTVLEFFIVLVFVGIVAMVITSIYYEPPTNQERQIEAEEQIKVGEKFFDDYANFSTIRLQPGHTFVDYKIGGHKSNDILITKKEDIYYVNTISYGEITHQMKVYPGE